MIKEKQCKSIGKAQGFKGCGKLTQFRKFGLCSSCYPTWLYTTDVGKLEIEKATLKAKKQTEVKKRKDKAEAKESLKSISAVIKDIKPIFQKFIRLRDKDLPCISCGSFDGLPQGGHFKKAEIYSGVIFDERNCHKQCQKCNVYLGGNEANYRVNLVKRFSESFVSELEDFANETRNYKYTKEELYTIKEKYSKKIKNISP